METIAAIGLMSGTSMDGIDAAILASDGQGRVTRGPSMFFAYDAAFRRRLEAALETARAIACPTERPGELAELERALTLRHAEAVAAFRQQAAGRFEPPSLIGFHGQTVLHRPAAGFTVQLGDGALLAAETGLPVVHDMRANDMAHGGQGAPLVPAYHRALAGLLPARHAGTWPVAFVNIGGVANITWLGETGDPVAFDTGPGNALIDQWVARHAGVPYDAAGAIASEGGVVAHVVERYMAAPFFERPGPKSLDRNDFTLEAADGLELADGARTLARVSAAAIHRAAAHLPERPRLWILSGGGRKNPFIVEDLRALAGRDAVIQAEDAGLSGDFMEAEAWAYLAVRALRGLPLTWPGTTGCRQPVTGGMLATP
ncbi:anhydro-N-acetylmuramic acid kinase [Aquibium sp. A9E412]|uniref:anhydro-N-acetylmuramic acid kinase n=1 Tax=Aquibium sp. A9E412 TaxID=2976767 RepID=UPI0025B1669F|nr:anhydro-N-acetylmuramic acid kinase [Aquibium sp. A9E412]MDN2567360.1 anhydro-N-acetylmuramic acid kinase [Aquibium sp. A9E412]